MHCLLHGLLQPAMDQLSQNNLQLMSFLGSGVGFFCNGGLQLGCKNSSQVQILGACLLEG